MSLLSVVAGSGPALSGDVDADGVAACSIAAWSTDTDPKGLRVRAGPGTSTTVIARLPPPVEVGHDRFGAEVTITGSKDGWFRIDKAILDDYVGQQKSRVVFEGEGWVSGRFLSLTVNDVDLRRDPSESAPAVAHLLGKSASGESSGPDSFIVDRLDACRGTWVEVEGTFLDARVRGWTTRTCSNQVTTCP